MPLIEVRKLFAKVPVLSGMRARGVLFILSTGFILLVGIGLVMATRGRSLVYDETIKILEEKVGNAVSKLGTKLSETAALARSEASLLKLLNHDEKAIRKVLPGVLDFNGNRTIAGGGIWPEPFLFSKNRERRSFFWGRDTSGVLKYFDDYNDPKGAGYHHEEWYVPTRYTHEDRCYWSGSYTDPYSFQPMVTCSVPAFERGKFLGVSTVDLKLDGLHEKVAELAKETGGYLFVLDRDNKFITFPSPDLAKLTGTGVKGKKTAEFMNVMAFAKKIPEFYPIAQMAESINRELLFQGKAQATYQTGLPKKLKDGSYQIDPNAAELITAILTDAFRNRTFLKQVSVPIDFLTKKESIAFAFHVPNTYWKLILVKPSSELVEASSKITWILLAYLSSFVLLVMVLAFLLVQRWIVRPIQQLGEVADRVILGDYQSRAKIVGRNEISVLGEAINAMLDRISERNQQLEGYAQGLEKSVKDRTQALEMQQSQLLANSKMAALGVMAGGVAHEINNPLAIIVASASRLRKLADQGSIENQQVVKVAEQIRDTANRIAKIVIGLKSFAREGSDDPMELTSLGRILQESVSFCEERFKVKGIRFEVEMPTELPLVKCRGVQISQVILNLLNNAVDAIESMKDPWIRLAIDFDDDKVRIRVRDSGLGIPEEIAQKLMTPFYTTKAVGKGTGLGLSISFGILESQGGKLSLNRGCPNTEFVIELPRGKYAIDELAA